MSWRIRLLTMILVVLMAGCAREVRLTSDPVPARISIDDSFVGYTPLSLHLSSSDRQLTIESPGYRPSTALLRRSFDSRSLFAVPVFPVMLVPTLSTTLADEYCIELQPGDAPLDMGVLDGVDH